ncbi:hypothetical protein Pla108_31120 [Botrimarina colliarenosi]|uniref:Uncharacterized protein n=1 Tax=Botrimarina colliarenosi TaxID=2528001 RepID=A0A5C6AAG9_9BACT|nr:hypothetical protein Pla108_31120 [Botrimarina colliarenosi]
MRVTKEFVRVTVSKWVICPKIPGPQPVLRLSQKDNLRLYWDRPIRIPSQGDPTQIPLSVH